MLRHSLFAGEVYERKQRECAQGALRPALRGRSACAPPRGRSKVVNKSIVLRTHLLSPRLCVLMTQHSWLARGASVRVRLRPFPLPFAPLCLFSLSLCPLSLILWSLACSPNMQRVVQQARCIDSFKYLLLTSFSRHLLCFLSLRICAQGCLMCLSLLPSCLLLFLLRQ